MLADDIVDQKDKKLIQIHGPSPERALYKLNKPMQMKINNFNEIHYYLGEFEIAKYKQDIKESQMLDKWIGPFYYFDQGYYYIGEYELGLK